MNINWVMYIHMYSCSARQISFEINLQTKDLKRNSSRRTQIHEYTPPKYCSGYPEYLVVPWDIFHWLTVSYP